MKHWLIPERQFATVKQLNQRYLMGTEARKCAMWVTALVVTIVRNLQRDYLGRTGSRIRRTVQTGILQTFSNPVMNQFNLTCSITCIKIYDNLCASEEHYPTTLSVLSQCI